MNVWGLSGSVPPETLRTTFHTQVGNGYLQNTYTDWVWFQNLLVVYNGDDPRLI